MLSLQKVLSLFNGQNESECHDFVSLTFSSLLYNGHFSSKTWHLFFKKLPATRHFFWLNAVAVLFFAGAIGNFIDRVRQGYVVDFFYFSLINFPIFNVADIYVTAAAFLLIFLCLFYYKEEDFEQIFPSGSSRQHSSEKKDND